MKTKENKAPCDQLGPSDLARDSCRRNDVEPFQVADVIEKLALVEKTSRTT